MGGIADIENLNDREALEHRLGPDARNAPGQRLASVPAGAPQNEGEPQ